MTARYIKLILLILILQLFASIVINEIYLLSNNTLKNNGNWTVMKKQVQMPLLGAENYYRDKVALRQSQLNLGAWHGFQGVIYKHTINPDKVEFDFSLTDDSYFYFIFNKNRETFTGIRISSHDAYKNMLLTAFSNGEFISKTELPLKNIMKLKWNHVKLDFNGKDSFSLFINNNLIGSFKNKFIGRQQIGFRGSFNPVYIDNVVIKQNGSDEILKESFANRKKQFESGILFFLIVITISFLTGLFQILRKSDIKQIAFSLIMLNMIILLISLPTLFTYYYVNELKTNYPRVHGLYRFYRNLMQEERNFVNTDSRLVTNRIMKNYNHEASKNVNRILFVGTSQTRGAGASTSEETLVRVTEDILNQSGIGQYECINAGVHGTRANALVKYYEDDWIKLRPKVTVINLSNNEGDGVVFRSSMQHFIELNNSAGIETIFILEANSREVNTDLLNFHEIMKKVGQANSIFMIDLHNYMLKKDDSGILWWDGVHMTSHGQRIAAEFIADKILAHLQEL